jgi:uncharacterized protein (DUF983 family)
MHVDLGGMVRTTFSHRCPACGRGPLFSSRFALRDRCPDCGLDLQGQHGAHYGGPIILGYAVGGITGLGTFAVLFLWMGYSAWVTWVSVGCAIVSVLLTFRHIKAHWTWWLYSVGELKPEPGD